jgi:hypothetical protein
LLSGDIVKRLNSCPVNGTIPVQDLWILAVAFGIKELDLRVEQTESKLADITDVFAKSTGNGLVDLKLGHQILLKENDRPTWSSRVLLKRTAPQHRAKEEID